MDDPEAYLEFAKTQRAGKFKKVVMKAAVSLFLILYTKISDYELNTG